MTPFDPTKPCQTRDGRAVRIICTDRIGGEPYSIVALVKMGDVEMTAVYPATGLAGGQCGERHTNDLINIPQRIHREYWVNVYGEHFDGTHSTFDSKPMADRYAAPKRLACVKVTIDCEEGEGL